MTALNPRTLLKELPCAACEYDLRGLPDDGNCPECGESVAVSARRESLYHADPKWLRRMIIGCWWVPLSLLLTAVGMPLLVLFGRLSTPELNAMTSTVACVIVVIGPWLIVGRAMPAQFETQNIRRSRIRALLLTWVALETASGAAFVLATGFWKMDDVVYPGSGLLTFLEICSIAENTVFALSAILLCFYGREVMSRTSYRKLRLGLLISATLIGIGATFLGLFHAATAIAPSILQEPRFYYLFAGIQVVFKLICLGGGILLGGLLAAMSAVRLTHIRRIAVRLNESK